MRMKQYYGIALDLAQTPDGRAYLAAVLSAAGSGQIYMRRIHLAAIRLALRRA